MRVIVTRPQREAQDWSRELQAHGLQVACLPLIQIVPGPDASALQRAWLALNDYAALMFVSANAVDGFFAERPGSADEETGDRMGRPSLPRIWAPGPGTRLALLNAGVPADRIDAPALDAAQFDSETLWQRVGASMRPGQRVLIVRGGDAGAVQQTQGSGRNWLARQIQEVGGEVDFVVAYQRVRPRLDTSQQALARQAASDGSVWLFSSSEAVQNLRQALPGQDWAAGRAVATHARIAEAAQQIGFGQVRVSRPEVTEVVASIESFA